MKKIILLLSIALYIFSPVESQKEVVLSTNITSSLDTSARDWIKLDSGFEFSLTGGDSLCLNIDDQIICGVEYDYSENLPTQNRTLDQNLEVGTTPGTFSVSNSGTAQYMIPLTVPIGVAGLQPNLAIVYNQGGPGILGYGFSLSGISSISRTFPNMYNDSSYTTDLDRYTLNGQRLISVTIGGNTYFQTEYDSKVLIEYDSTGDNFTQYNPNGTIITYGNGTNSKLLGSSSTYTWYVTSITDFHENSLQYIYTQDSNTTQVLLDRIEYKLAGESDPFSEIVLYYENDKVESDTKGIMGNLISFEHLVRKIKIFEGVNLFREYNFSYTQFKPSASEASEQIYSYLYQIEEKDNNGKSYNPLIFNWITKPVDQLYEKLYLIDVIDPEDYNEGDWKGQYHAGDLDGDGNMELISDGYHDDPNKHDLILSTSRDTIDGPSSAYTSLLLGDFNGNGKSEILWHQGTTKLNSTVFFNQQTYNNGVDPDGNDIVLYHSWTGSSFSTTGTLSLTELSDKTINEIFVGDANGDQKSDIFFIASDGWCYIYSCNSSYSFSLLASGKIGGADDYYLGDFNGDGKSDILKKTLFRASIYAITEADSINIIIGHNLVSYSDDFHIGDFNGDGLADLAYSDSDTIMYSNGDGFTIVDESTVDRHGNADFNGDWKSDLFEIDHSTTSKFKLELSTPFPTEEYFASSIFNAVFLQSGFQDLSADGMSDLYIVFRDLTTGENIKAASYSTRGFDIDDDTTYAAIVFAKAIRAPSFQPLLLANITDGLNNTTTIHYELLTDQNSYTRVESSDDDFYNSLSPRPIVDYYSIEDGLGGTRSINLNYEDALIHRYGKGSLGFSKIVSVDSIHSIKTTKEYGQSITASDATKIIFPHLTSQTVKTTSNNQISVLTQSYDVHKYSDTKHCYPYLETAEHTNSLTNQTKTGRYNYNSKSQNGFNYSVPSSAVDDYTVSKDSTIFTEDLTLNLSSDIFIINQTKKELIKTRSGLSGYKKFTTTYQYPTNSPILTSITSEPDHSSLKRIKAYQYDSYGNPTRVVDSVPSSTGRYITYEYDDTKRFVTETQNNLGHTTTATYNIFGLISSESDVNGLETNYTYGTFNRLLSKISPDSTQSFANSFDWVTPGTGSAPNLSVYKTVTSIPAQDPVTTYFDKLGREIMRIQSGFSGETIYTETKYNTKGQIDSVSLPYESTPIWVINSFDPYGRRTQQRKLSDTISWSYSNMKVTEKKYGISSEKTYGNDGLLSSVQDASNPQVSFTYNVAGLDSIITAPGSITTKIEYDHYGRKTKLIDPDAGTIKYYYNGYGDLTAQVNASDDSTTMTYDNLGRLTQKTEIDGDGSNPNRTVSITYDTINGKGLVNRITVSGEISEKYNYDEVSRVCSKSVTISGEPSPFTESYAYDEYSRLDSLTYPSGFQIAHSYNTYGYLDIITRTDNGDLLWEAKDYNELGMIEEFWLNNSSEKTYYDYDNIYLLSDISTYRDWYIQDLDYIWDGSRHLLTSREDDKIGKSESFIYDDLNRLTRWSVASGRSDTIVYRNDYSGRINSKTDVGTYDYASNPPYHAIEELTNVGTLVDTVCHEISYTAFLKTKTLIHSHNQDSIEFYYGGNNQRYKKKVYDGSLISSTLYTHGNFEVITADDTTRKLHYINTPTGLTTIYVDNSNTATDTMYYIHKDHLGSFNLITNDQDTLKSYLNFDPWGKRRNPDNCDFEDVPTSYIFERGFTGHEHIDHFGLINMNGRMYDPALGMMLGPDMFVSQPLNTQNYNRYSYALNNPLLYTDPSGWWPDDDPPENYQEPKGPAPLPGGGTYWNIPSWWSGPNLWSRHQAYDWEGIFGGAMRNLQNFRPPEAGPGFEEHMVSIGYIYLENQLGIGSWVSGSDIRSFTGEYAWLDAMLYYNSLFPKDHFTDYYSDLDNWNLSLTASTGDGDGKTLFGISGDFTFALPVGGTIEFGDVPNINGNYLTTGFSFGMEFSYSINLLWIKPKSNFKSANFYGRSSEFDFSLIPWTTVAKGGDIKHQYPVNQSQVSYTIRKIGFGIGWGFSFTPNAKTRKHYLFYGDPNPKRFYWNPTSR